MEQCDATASPNDESPTENGDSDVDLNYSLNDNSYSDSSDSNSSYCMWSNSVHLKEHKL